MSELDDFDEFSESEDLETLSSKMDDCESRLDNLDQKVDEIKEDMESESESLKEAIEAISGSVTELNQKLDELRLEVAKSLPRVILLLSLLVFVGLLAYKYFGFKVSVVVIFCLLGFSFWTVLLLAQERFTSRKGR